MRGEWSRKKIRNVYRKFRPLPPPTDPRHKGFHSACYAPSTSMYFDQFGDVRSCCQNTQHLLGNIREQTIREIWDSTATRSLRNALTQDDYSLGCGFCKWQDDQGDPDRVYARAFDLHRVDEIHPDWPVQMEFSMTNSCNLQCVMCNGNWSSSIRSHREHRPPLRSVYGEEFFDELAQFLPHLVYANFAGGEPFLGREPLRVMEMLGELDSPCAVGVVTNGTQWTDRVRQICERLPIYFMLSLDGITKATYESIRVGADFDLVMAHLDELQRYAARHGTRVTITHCLMRPNVHEFPQLLRFAEDRGLEVTLNDVVFPTELSLYQLPATELREVVSSMERDPSGLIASLDRLRPLWDRQVAALRHRLEELDGGSAVMVRPWANPAERAELWIDTATRVLMEWVDGVEPLHLVFDPLVNHFAVEAGPRDFGDRSTLTKCREVEDIIEHLAHLLVAPTSSHVTTSGLLHDIVLREDDPNDHHQFRVTWNDAVNRTTVLIAERVPPVPLRCQIHPEPIHQRSSIPAGTKGHGCDAR